MENKNIGVFTKLNDPSLSWQEKVKVAHYAWNNNDCIIPNKQQVLLGWISQQLVDIYRKKKSCSTSSLKDLWEYLGNILASLGSKDIQKIASLVLIPQLLQVFTEVLSSEFDKDIALTVVQCGQRILSNPELNIAFLSKFENYLLYLSVLLRTFSNYNEKSGKHSTLHLEMFSLLEISLNLYIPLQRRQANHKKLFEKACQHLLVPIISVCHLLMEDLQPSVNVSQDRINELIDQLNQGFSDALFRKEHLQEYAASLKALNTEQLSNETKDLEPKPKKAKVGNYTKELFETLRNQCSQCNGNNRNTIIKFLPQMFIEFLKARRFNNLGPASLEFEFFTEMCSLMGVNFKEDVYPPDLSSHLRLVHSLLNTLLTYDVYQVAEDNTNGGIQLKWFNNFLNILVKMQPNHDVFQCFQVLLQLNHYIIEPHLSTVLQHCWTSEDTQGINKSTSVSDLFLSSLVKTYAKLRQFDKFIGQMLKSLHSTTNINSVWSGFSKLFQEQVVKSCQSLPYGLATSLWKIFNQEIIDNFLPTLQLLSQNKSGEKSTDLEKKSIYCFERVVGLYRTFLLNTTLGRVAEQHKSEGIISNLTNLCLVLNDEILGPALTFLPNISDSKLYKSVCASVLVLYHTLQEMNMFLGKFGLVTDDANKEIAAQHWNKHLWGYLKQDQKKKGMERIIYIKVLVAIQRLLIHMRNRVSPVKESETQDLVNFVFQWLERSLHSSSSWNSQLWSINNTMFSSAYWFTLCSNAPILLTACSDQHRQHFIHYLIKTLLHENHEDHNEHGRGVSLVSTSRKLLLSTGFHQTPLVQRTFVTTLWNEIAQLLGNSSSDMQSKLHRIIASSGTVDEQSEPAHVDMSDDSEDSSSEQESASEDESEELIPSQAKKPKDVPSTVSCLVPAGKMLKDVLLKLSSGEKLDDLASETAKEISDHIALLTFLPLDWLTDVNHVGCVLGLVASDALANNIAHKQSNDESLRVSFVSRRLLSVLLQGCISKKRHLIHHVIDMDSLHSWMLTLYLNLPTMEGDGISKQLQDVSIELLSLLMRYALKIGKPVTLINSFVKKLIAKVDALTSKLKDESKKSANKALKQDQSLLRITGTVMDVLEKVISCKTSRLNEVKMAAHIFSQCALSILALLQAIEDKNKSNTKEKDAKNAALQDYPVLVDIYSAVLHVYCISQTSRKFSRSKEEFQEFSWRPLFDCLRSFAVDSIIHKEQSTASENSSNEQKKESLSNVTSMTSSLNLLNVTMSSLETLDLDLPERFHSHLLASILTFLDHLDTEHKEVIVLKETALNVILSLLQGCSYELIIELLHGLTDELTISNTNSSKRLSTCIQVWLTLVSGKFAKIKKKELRPVLPQVLMALQTIVQQSTEFDLTILTLELMTRILSLGTSMIHPHHCSLVFHGSLLVPLDPSDKRFPEMFHTQFSLLSTVLFHHSEAVYKVVHVFMTCVKNMLRGLCSFSNDRNSDSSRENSQDKQIMCAEKMSRLYQEIASHKAAMSKYLPYMIAEYVLQIQEVQLQENVKKVMVPGIYCLIDSCGEHEIALLHAVLDKGSRELFTSLHQDYNKYHKFKGKV